MNDTICKSYFKDGRTSTTQSYTAAKSARHTGRGPSTLPETGISWRQEVLHHERRYLQKLL